MTRQQPASNRQPLAGRRRAHLVGAILLAAVASHVLRGLASSATSNPVHWTATPDRTPAVPGKPFAVTLNASIDPGWHLYALEEPDGGPLPTEVGLAAGDPLTLLDVDEPKPRMVNDPVTHVAAGVFQDLVSFTLHLRAPAARPAAGAVSHILVRYQTCNDRACLPPHTETIALPLEGVVRAGSEQRGRRSP